MIMLIALTIMLLGGGGNDLWLFPEDFTDRVETVITEERRQTTIIDLFEKMADSHAIYSDRVKKIAENVSLLNHNYDATEQEFEPVIDSLLQARKTLQTTVLDARFNLTDQFMQDEWQQIFIADSVKNQK